MWTKENTLIGLIMHNKPESVTFVSFPFAYGKLLGATAN